VHDPNNQNSFRQAGPGAVQHPQQAGMISSDVAPHMQKTFEIDYTDDLGKRWMGNFVCKKLSVRDYLRIGVRKTQLNGGFHYDAEQPGKGIPAEIDDANSMVAHLELALIQSPIWWDLDQIYDLELVTKVYVEIMKFENSFSKRRSAVSHADNAGSSEAGRQGATQQSGSVGSITQVGGNQIPPSLDP
jgi:hypothetical protein